MAIQIITDTSKFRNFKDILDYYINLFNDVLNTSDTSNKKTHGANPFLPDKWELPSVNEDTTVQYYYNQGYNFLKDLIDTVEDTKNGIHKGLRTLFINYDDPEEYWHEDMNYNLINAYAETSRSYQYYNKKTEEFEERPEYFWTRGNYYDMLPMCTAGKYLLAYKASVEKACEIMESYKILFYNFTCNYTNGNGETDGVLLTYDSVNSSYVVNTGESDYVYGTKAQVPNYPGARNNRDRGYNSQQNRSMYFYQMFWKKYLSEMESKVKNLGDKPIKSMLKIGKATSYPEQTNDSKVVYTRKYYGDSLWDNMSTGKNGKSAKEIKHKVTTTKKVSSECGTYESNIDVKEA